MKLFDLPKLPFTERAGCADQAFFYDEEANHGWLQHIYPQGYGQTMGDRTYLQVFADFVRPYLKGMVVDIGGNDGSLGSLLGRPYMVVDGDGAIESCELGGENFVSSHTIEHLRNPEILISKVGKAIGGGVFGLQFPSLDLLVEDSRFDQIHHQHLHYFSERSITKLLKDHGLRVIAKQWNPDHWGTLMLVCVKGDGQVTGKRITGTDIKFAKHVFQMEMAICKYFLKEGFVCYGASPMLPIFGYYLPIDKAEFIAEDNKKKCGGRVKNQYDLKGRDVLITVTSKLTARLLTSKAFEAGARNVINPFHQL